MSEKFDEKQYFEKWDHNVMIIMTVLALGLTAFAIVLNLMVADAQKECTTTDYVYCGVKKVEHH